MIDINFCLDKRKNLNKDIQPEIIEKMHLISDELVKCFKNGGKILTCGNGGSAANAQHITGDLVGRFKLERKGFPCITLSVDNCAVTALSNDYDYKDLFAKEVVALGRPGDILICLSSSSNSENILRAAKTAKELGVKTIGILGNEGGNIAEFIDHLLIVPCRDTDLYEEFAIMLIHIIIEETENTLCNTI